jgi:hypothetical protein
VYQVYACCLWTIAPEALLDEEIVLRCQLLLLWDCSEGLKWNSPSPS